jgi:hypothetical protein
MAATMQIQFTTNFRDYVAAQTLHAKRSGFPYLAHCLSHCFYPVFGVLILLFEFTPHHLAGSPQPKVYSVICGITLLCIPVYLRLMWKRCYSRSRTGSGECILDFSEEMIRAKGEHSKSEIEWSAIRSFSEDERAFLLYLAPARFLPIPKRFCTEVQIEELRSLFQRQIRPASQ